MKIKATKVMASYIGKLLPEYRVIAVELTDDNYIALVGRDLFWRTQEHDFNEKTRLTKAIKIVYPEEYYAMPRYICTSELNDIFKREGVTSEKEWKQAIVDNFTI